MNESGSPVDAHSVSPRNLPGLDCISKAGAQAQALCWEFAACGEVRLLLQLRCFVALWRAGRSLLFQKLQRILRHLMSADHLQKCVALFFLLLHARLLLPSTTAPGTLYLLLLHTRSSRDIQLGHKLGLGAL